MAAFSDREHVLSFIRRLHPIAPACGLIRIGSHEDGGYLLPDDLDGIKHCFSGGVGPSSSFEIDLLQRAGIRSFLADASVDGPEKGLKKYIFDG